MDPLHGQDGSAQSLAALCDGEAAAASQLLHAHLSGRNSVSAVPLATAVAHRALATMLALRFMAAADAHCYQTQKRLQGSPAPSAVDCIAAHLLHEMQCRGRLVVSGSAFWQTLMLFVLNSCLACLTLHNMIANLRACVWDWQAKGRGLRSNSMRPSSMKALPVDSASSTLDTPRTALQVQPHGINHSHSNAACFYT